MKRLIRTIIYKIDFVFNFLFSLKLKLIVRHAQNYGVNDAICGAACVYAEIMGAVSASFQLVKVVFFHAHHGDVFH